MNDLRPYQQAAVDGLRDAIRQNGSVVFACPTGSGKSVVAGEIARLATEKGSRTLFLIHRRELVKQLRDTLNEFVPQAQPGIIAAGFPATPWSKLQIASVQSLARREYVHEPNLIIVDEAHHVRAKTWERVLGRWPNAKRIGLTATPMRLDGRGLGAHFESMIVGPTIPELVDERVSCAMPHIADTVWIDVVRFENGPQRRIQREGFDGQGNGTGGGIRD